MTLDALEIETGDAPRASLIVLHGLGADGHDFVPIAEELDLAAVGPVRFVFPHAPMRPVTINAGYVMRAWYDIVGNDLQRPQGNEGPFPSSLTPSGGGLGEAESSGPHEDEAGLRASQAQVEALIERERQRGIDASRIVLMGFSQGCAVSLLTGLRHRERLAGIAGLSGYLPLAATTAAERSTANADVPIFLAHGTLDPVVAFPRGAASRDALRALGHEVEWHEYPMEHSVCMEEIADLNRWLVRVLA